MKLIINSNPIISAFIKKSKTRELILNPKITLITPNFALDEIRKYEETICNKGNISRSEFQLLLILLFEKIRTIPYEEYKDRIFEAKSLITDTNDVPFLALSLATKNDGIWSNDLGFKEQTRTKVWSTKELLEYYHLI